MYLRVSALRRATKLRSWTSTSSPSRRPSSASERTDTMSGPLGLESSRGGAPASDWSSSHRSPSGRFVVARNPELSDGQKPTANTRSSSVSRVK